LIIPYQGRRKKPGGILPLEESAPKDRLPLPPLPQSGTAGETVGRLPGRRKAYREIPRSVRLLELAKFGKLAMHRTVLSSSRMPAVGGRVLIRAAY